MGSGSISALFAPTSHRHSASTLGSTARRWCARLLASPRAWAITRRRGVSGGRNLFVGQEARVCVTPSASLLLGEGIWIGERATVKVEGNGALALERGASLNEYSHLVCSGRLAVGEDVGINDHTVIHIHGNASIGRDTMIGAYVYIVDGGHKTGRLDVPMRLQGRAASTPLIIGEDVWIGTKVTITRGVTIGRGAIIGANAVLTCDVGAYEVWGGIPARFLKMRAGAESQVERRSAGMGAALNHNYG